MTTPEITDLEFFASCLAGAEDLLAQELRGIGIRRVRPLRGGCAFYGSVRDGLAACLWSRLASRVLVVVARIDAVDADTLYQAALNLSWEDVLLPSKSFAVRAQGTNKALRNTKFSAMKLKDAVCDRLRSIRGARPDVDAERPDLLLALKISGERATVSVDLSGAPLSQRAYLGRAASSEKQLSCLYAATLLAFCSWKDLASRGFRLVDARAARTGAMLRPARTGLSILEHEAYSVLAHDAPGNSRERWGFFGWARFDQDVWEALIDDADARAEEGAQALQAAKDALDAEPAQLVCALLIDPETQDAASVSADAAFAQSCSKAPEGSVFACVGGREALLRLGHEPSESLRIGSGRVSVELNRFDAVGTHMETIEVADPFGGAPRSIGVFDRKSEQFAARLVKVARERRKWARKEVVSCYRVYDADLPEYAVAIDLYQGAGADTGKSFAHIAEYAPPSSVDEAKAVRRMSDILAISPVVLGLAPETVFVKTRRREKGGSQYAPKGARSFTVTVGEDGLLFEVDLSAYLDTGLFLDHRQTRKLIRQKASGKSFLNLFAYTGSASVYAAAGGAQSTCTVDLSGTYLEWAYRNMQLNGFSGQEHSFERDDVMRWITDTRRSPRRFDLIFVDPPTFSNSKAMGKRTWEVQRDHVELLIGVSRLLTEGGEAIFSCNLRSFKPDLAQLERYGVVLEDISDQTVPRDFERNKKIHRCYLVRRDAAKGGIGA